MFYSTIMWKYFMACWHYSLHSFLFLESVMQPLRLSRVVEKVNPTCIRCLPVCQAQLGSGHTKTRMKQSLPSLSLNTRWNTKDTQSDSWGIIWPNLGLFWVFWSSLLTTLGFCFLACKMEELWLPEPHQGDILILWQDSVLEIPTSNKIEKCPLFPYLRRTE